MRLDRRPIKAVQGSRPGWFASGSAGSWRSRFASAAPDTMTAAFPAEPERSAAGWPGQTGGGQQIQGNIFEPWLSGDIVRPAMLMQARTASRSAATVLRVQKLKQTAFPAGFSQESQPGCFARIMTGRHHRDKFQQAGRCAHPVQRSVLSRHGDRIIGHGRLPGCEWHKRHRTDRQDGCQRGNWRSGNRAAGPS